MSDQPCHRPPHGCTNFKLRQLTRRVSQHYDRIVAACGLKTTQYSLLSQIERLGPMRPGDLAAAMKIDASTLTRNLQPLVAAAGSRSGRAPTAIAPRPRHGAGRDKRSEAQRGWKHAQLALNELLGATRVARCTRWSTTALPTWPNPAEGER